MLLILTSVAKFTFRSQTPLWLDEVATGVIASQPTFEGFLRQCYLDVNAPLYFLVAWLWAHVAGLSNVALRFPAALCACAAPLIALWRWSAIPRDVRLIWSGLIACWLPVLFFATEARGYALVLLLATANTAAFASLLKTPSLKRAFAWTVLSALLVLAHTVAALLVGCQGLVYLLLHRRTALRTWPAAVAFLPTAASVAAQMTLLASFSNAGNIYMAPVTLAHARDVIAFLIGGGLIVDLVLIWAATCLLTAWLTRRTPRPPRVVQIPISLWLVPATSVAAAALFLGIAIWKHILVDRYLMAMVPGALLGLALIAERFQRSWRIAPALLIVLEFSMGVGIVVGPSRDHQLFSSQLASESLMNAGVKTLVFLWDDPIASSGQADGLAQLGGFFFARAGRALPVDPIRLPHGADPNPILLAHAAGPDTGIVWMYDTRVRGTEAAVYPPALHRLDPRWTCRDFGSEASGHALACRRDTAG